MGACLDSSNPNVETTRTIETNMKHDRVFEASIKKLLFLGAGSSGKSTIFKQLKNIYKDGLDNSEKAEHVESIRADLISNMRLLVKKSASLYKRNSEYFRECKLNTDDPRTRQALETLGKIDEYIGSDSPVIDSLEFLWKQPAIQATWSHRLFYAISECTQFFFEHLNRVCDDNYEPTHEDLLLARVRTTGIVHIKFALNNNEFHVYDVGGQRNERKKWVHCFDDVTVIIFVASLSSFCEVLFEDETKNSMQESLELFGETVNLKFFDKKDTILFLNKKDLFDKRIAEGNSLALCFGDTCSSSECPVYDPVSKTPPLDSCISKALTFIRKQYTQLKNDKSATVYIHVTQATDLQDIQKVFLDIQTIVFRNAIKTGHLI